MIESSNSHIEHLIVHRMGAKAEGGCLRIAKRETNIGNYSEENTVADVLRLFFFKSFKTEAYYTFHKDSDEGSNNVVRDICTAIFNGTEQFYDASVKLASWLFEQSNHPRIRGGEIYIAHFSDVVVDGLQCDAIGIFKSESKETFLKVQFGQDSEVQLGTQEGISIRRIDKGCIIFNIEQEDGYRISAVDNINKGCEAHFWFDDFLGLKPREDNYFFTDNYLQMCRSFVKDVYNEDNHVARADQMDMMNKTVNFFENTPKFSHDDFLQSVMAEPDVINAFNDYKQQYETEHDIPQSLPEVFEVSKDAVKGEKRNFKSILKLDKNFHVYVHGSRYYMEKGYDESKDMNFYKLFFKNEL
ncbi:MAG: nucleoid-associated protein [Marinilabiliaceae bacterium]|nr:nucleoid-associated protein [Marinilabiliaceae bacterium]